MLEQRSRALTWAYVSSAEHHGTFFRTLGDFIHNPSLDLAEKNSIQIDLKHLTSNRKCAILPPPRSQRGGKELRIDNSRELYKAVKTICPNVKWDEAAWRAYKATRVCHMSQRLWLHFSIEDITKQTEGKLRLKEISAIMQVDLEEYKLPPEIIKQADKPEIEELRLRLIKAGFSKPENYLLVWQIYRRGLKGQAAADAANMSRQTFNRYLAQANNLMNRKYEETQSDIILLGSLRLYFDGKLYLEYFLELAEQTRNGTYKLGDNVEAGEWVSHYFLWLQNAKTNKPEAAATINAWLDKVIEAQRHAKKLLES
jgi:hypothetical protein